MARPALIFVALLLGASLTEALDYAGNGDAYDSRDTPSAASSATEALDMWASEQVMRIGS